MIKLFHNDMSVCAQKVRLVLAHKNLDWDSEHLNLRAGDQFKPEFCKINPKGVIPVLQHDQAMITESNTIIEYLEEVFPTPPLMPTDPVARAKVRYWMIKLDAGLHDHIAVISFCLAFRFQMLDRYKTEQELEGFFNSIADPSRANVMRDVVTNGLQSERLTLALYAYDKLLDEMNSALASDGYLVGGSLSLADFSMLPYIERLQQLRLERWWLDKPNITTWLAKARDTLAYQKGMADWHNPTYIELMKTQVEAVFPEVEVLLKALQS